MCTQALAAAYHRIADANAAVGRRVESSYELHGTAGSHSYPPDILAAARELAFEFSSTLDERHAVFGVVLEADVATLADLQHKARAVEREFDNTTVCPRGPGRLGR